MREINISRPEDYYTQLNNKIVPHSSCNTTSMIEALVVADIPFAYPKDMQPEDYLTQIMNSERVLRRYREKYPHLYELGYSPAEVHELLSWAVNNILVAADVTEFSAHTSIQQIVFDIADRGRPVVVSTEMTRSGHIVTVVGIVTSQKGIERVREVERVEPEMVTYFIIDDPYGNYYSDYKDQRGNDVRMPYPDFNELVKTVCDSENKWAHRIII